VQKTKPNILYIISDQQRPDSLGCYGNGHNPTPNIDKLASEGVVFDNCYVQNPLCCPARYSILTGRYPRSHRVRSNWYAPRYGEKSFGHQLGKAGYQTAMIGKMHLTPWFDRFGFHGRIIAEAKFHTTCPDDYERFLQTHGSTRQRLYDFDHPAYIQNCTAVKSKLPQELHIDSFVGRSICEYLKHAREPFCVFASFLSPHNPYDPPEPYDTLYLKENLSHINFQPGETDRKPPEAFNYINDRLKWPFKTDELSKEQIQIQRAYYLSTCTLIDDWMGRILEVLKQQGMYDNTIIVYSSDHGDLLGDHGLLYKQCFYEQSVRVPLIIHAPSRFKSGRVSQLVESIDLFNTFCEFGNAWSGHGIQGKSLLPLLAGTKGYSHHEAAFSENYFGRMVRYAEYKMVYYPGKPYGELYNLEEDPDEQINLWDKLDGSPIKRKLKDILLAWAFESEDQLPLPVRPDHQDLSPREHCLYQGGTDECQRQSWYIQDLLPLYDNWSFSEEGTLR
jgi:choline-sulfatase